MYREYNVLFKFPCAKWCYILTPDSPPEDLAGSSEVVRSTRGVGVHPLTQESKVLHCEVARNAHY